MDYALVTVKPSQRLTPREAAVARLVAQNLPDKAIAAELRIGERRVRKLITSACKRLGLRNRRNDLGTWWHLTKWAGSGPFRKFLSGLLSQRVE